MDISVAVRADFLVATPFNRPLIATADFFSSVQTAFTAQLFASLSTSYVGLELSQISITIIRQREVVTVTRESAFMVDCIVLVGDDLLFPSVFPEIDFAAVLAAFPAAPPEGPAFAILSIDVTQTVSLTSTFSFTLDLYDLGDSILEDIRVAYQTSFEATAGVWNNLSTYMYIYVYILYSFSCFSVYF